MNRLNKCLFLLIFMLCNISLYGQSVFYLVPTINQTRPIDQQAKSTESFLSNIHTGIHAKYISKELGFRKFSGSVDFGFTVNKYEYVTLLHKWDHGLEGAIINTSTQRILLKRSTFNLGYGISTYYSNFIRLELASGFTYTPPGAPKRVTTFLDLSQEPGYNSPDLVSSYTSDFDDHLNFYLRFSAIASPGNRTGVGLSVTYNMIPEKPASGEFTLSNNTGSSYLKSTFSPRLLTINFGLYINLYRTKE